MGGELEWVHFLQVRVEEPALKVRGKSGLILVQSDLGAGSEGGVGVQWECWILCSFFKLGLRSRL